MKNTGLIGAFLITALAISLLPTVMAAETSQPTTLPIDNQTIQKDIQIMNDPLGAQIRLLQLENAIDIHIAIGNKVIQKAQELNKNITGLEAILQQMQDLKTEVQQADPNSPNATQEFVDLKENAISLTQQFRETARSLFTPDELQQLRQEQKQIRQERRQQAKEIREKIREYNQEKLKEMETQLGINIQNIITQMQQGNITTEQAKQMIRQEVLKLPREKQLNIYKNIKEKQIKQKIIAKERMTKIMKNFRIRYKKMLERRLNNTMHIQNEEVKKMIQQNLEKQLSQINNTNNTIIPIPGTSQQPMNEMNGGMSK